MKSLDRKTVLLSAVCLACTGFLLFRLLYKPPSLDVIADDQVKSLLFGDKQAAYKLLPEEVLLNDPMSIEDFSGIVDRVLVGNWSGNPDFKRERVWHMLYANAGAAGLNEYTKYGLKRGFGTLVYMRKGKPLSSITYLMFESWRLRYYRDHDVPDTEDNRVISLYLGLQRDGEYLLAHHYGLVDVLDPETGQMKFRSLKNVKQQCQDYFRLHGIDVDKLDSYTGNESLTEPK